MTRILVSRGSNSSSAGPSRSSAISQPQPSAPQTGPSSKEEEQEREAIQESSGLDEIIVSCGTAEDKNIRSDDLLPPEGSQGTGIETGLVAGADKGKSCKDDGMEITAAVQISERLDQNDLIGLGTGSSQIVTGGSCPPPPPPVPPPKPSSTNMNSRISVLGGSNAVRIGSPRKPSTWPVVLTRSPSSGSRPSSPRSNGEVEGYNSADEQGSCLISSYDDPEREHLFELDIRRVKGLEVKRMLQDGNCLFRAVADQVYGDPETYDLARQMCIDYMERERDHFSQFITEGFTSYCKRKRRDKVYGNNVEIQAFSEMYNRPIHIYSYGTEPINIFHGGYATDTPPIRLSYHHGNHYNSLVDPRRVTVGAGLGFSSLQGANLDKDRVKAAIKAQQDQQIENALLAEGRFYSDLELTEKEIERMVIEESRAEYLAEDKLRQQLVFRESSTSGAEPSSSGATAGPSPSEPMLDDSGAENAEPGDAVSSSSVQMVLSMGFGYLQVIEAYSIFGDDVDSMVCYLLEMGGNGAYPGSSRRKGKAAE